MPVHLRHLDPSDYSAVIRVAGCTEVHGVTSPVNTGSIAYHRAMGFELVPGDAMLDGLPVASDHDGRGNPRVRLRKRI